MDSLNPDSLPPVEAVSLARPPRVWKFWGTLLWGLFIFAAMFVGQVVPMLAIVIWKTGTIDMAEAVHIAGDGRALALTVIFGLPFVLLAMLSTVICCPLLVKVTPESMIAFPDGSIKSCGETPTMVTVELN